jgi:type II secretory pathway pseudopilin PulG
MRILATKAEIIKSQGFTIIETIVAIFVFTLIMGAVASSIVMLYRTGGYTTDQAIAINEARRGVDIMAEEIRKARYGEDGSYPIESAASKEFVFYSDIDNDGDIEKVRYYLATLNAGSDTKDCVTTSKGGSCSVVFSGFLTGNLKSAQVVVSTEGYYGNSSRYADFYADGTMVSTLCASGCTQCAGAWQGTQTYDVTSYAADGTLQLMMDSSSNVKNSCSWQVPNHAMTATFAFSWVEEIPNSGNELRKGVIEPTGSPVGYPAANEVSKIITSYVRNAPPIFTYYDADGEQITSDPSILTDTKMMRLFMVINVDVNRAPGDYDLEQYVQLRNLKDR